MLSKRRPQGLEICLTGMQHLHNFYCPNIYTPSFTVNLLPELERKHNLNSQRVWKLPLRRVMDSKGPSSKSYSCDSGIQQWFLGHTFPSSLLWLPHYNISQAWGYWNVKWFPVVKLLYYSLSGSFYLGVKILRAFSFQPCSRSQVFPMN